MGEFIYDLIFCYMISHANHRDLVTAHNALTVASGVAVTLCAGWYIIDKCIGE